MNTVGVTSEDCFARQVHQTPVAGFVKGEFELRRRGDPVILVAQLCPEGAHVHLSASAEFC